MKAPGDRSRPGALIRDQDRKRCKTRGSLTVAAAATAATTTTATRGVLGELLVLLLGEDLLDRAVHVLLELGHGIADLAAIDLAIAHGLEELTTLLALLLLDRFDLGLLLSLELDALEGIATEGTAATATAFATTATAFATTATTLATTATQASTATTVVVLSEFILTFHGGAYAPP